MLTIPGEFSYPILCELESSNYIGLIQILPTTLPPWVGTDHTRKGIDELRVLLSC